MSTNFLKKYLSMLQQTKPILTPIDQKKMKATTQNIKDNLKGNKKVTEKIFMSEFLSVTFD